MLALEGLPLKSSKIARKKEYRKSGFPLYIFLCLLTSLVIFSCDGFKITDTDTTSENDDNQESVLEENSEQDSSTGVNVSFTLPGTYKSIGAKDSQKDLLLQPNELIYYDISVSSPILHRQSLLAGVNQIELQKNSMNVIGFVHNPSLGNTSKNFGKDISSGIQVIGNLQIVSAGLDSLPISENAGNTIALGELTTNNNSVSSTIDAAQFADSSGYAEADLLSYSFYDDGLARLINPDVDGNGVYDVDENRLWQVTASRDGGHFYRNDFSGASPAISSSSMIGSLFSIVFWLNRSFPHPEFSTVFLKFPPDVVYKDRNGTTVSGMYANWGAIGEGPGGEFNQYYFNYINEEIKSPATPFKGDYELTINNVQYTYKNLSFLTPTGGSPEGFIFPETRITYDSEDYVQKLYYSWWVVKNGTFVRPTETEVRLAAKQYYYYFPKIWVKQPEDFGQVYYRSGEMDLSSYKIKKSELGGVAGEPNALRSVYWDRMGNEWNFSFHYNEDRPVN